MESSPTDLLGQREVVECAAAIYQSHLLPLLLCMSRMFPPFMLGLFIEKCNSFWEADSAHCVGGRGRSVGCCPGIFM